MGLLNYQLKFRIRRKEIMDSLQSKKILIPLKNLLMTVSFLCPLVFFSQGQPSLAEDTVLQKNLPEVFITATRTPKTIQEVVSRSNSIYHQEIESLPALNSDDLLQLIPGANIDRHQGIYSKNSGITLRGLNGTPRTLVLIDGVPISKTDGGGVNWNRIVTDNIEKIEVLKGPASAVYGGNALAGVINIITQKPKKALEGDIKTSIGTYNTTGGSIRLNGKPENSKFYYGVNAFYRQGDGYLIIPEVARDSLDVLTYLWETGVTAKLGYQYNTNSYTEIEYTYYNDKRGDGTKIFEPDGGYNRYPTNYLRLATGSTFGKIDWTIRYFYQNENYLRQSETMSRKRNNKYTLYETDAIRTDQGVWSNFDYKATKTIDVIFGFDVKRGSVNSTDIYYTSTDILINKGKMDFIALFTAAEWKPAGKRLVVSAGLRYDAAKFYDGEFLVKNPTTLSEFMSDYPTVFNNETWDEWSPKLGVKYLMNDRSDFYLSYSKGFRPGMLDDMCRNGNVSKGFKLANPQLKPETANNYEAGATLQIAENIRIEPSLYFISGHDFQYFVGNGDSIITGGDNLKPVLQRQNVSGAEVKGVEITCSWKLNKQFSLITNYAYNDSRITNFDTTGRVAKDLTGKFLMEVPENQFSAGLFHHSKIIDGSIVYNYKDSQWIDDENTQKSPSYSTVDVKAGKVFNKFNISLTIQDIFNSRYLDSKGYISPGRFFMLSFSYNI